VKIKILCTGGKGFLGSKLAPELTSRGHQVELLDRSNGNLAINGIALDLVQEHSPELVVHLAANPGRVFGEENPSKTVDDNVNATIYVARACARFKVRLCYVSTSEIYGDYRSAYPLTESDSGVGRLLNLYAITKWTGELVSQLYAPDDLLIIRPSMTYGPGMATGFGRAALPTMIDNFLHGKPYMVHANTARSWCYIEDLVRGMADVIERGDGVYNVGRDDDLRNMVSLAHLVCDVLGTNHDLIKIGDPDSTIRPVKDISMNRLRSLGWKPQVDIIEGIKKTADSLR
jgi:nucleoside-diphosphate-sugar epimerase